MTQGSPQHPLIAIACGGTGGHLFPGLAVAEELQFRGCRIALLISEKEVDQQAVRGTQDMEIKAWPAVGLANQNRVAFIRGFLKSLRLARAYFKQAQPSAVLAMGGFTSAAPIVAARLKGIPTFLHEANTIPGRANRWLAPWVSHTFVGFASTANRFGNASVQVVGTPVRSQFQESDPGACRMALGLDPDRPVLLVMGGSQGAQGINRGVVTLLPKLIAALPELQFFHLTGPQDFEAVKTAYQDAGTRAVVHPFFTEMELALGAATVAISRAGASSIAEFSALRIPALLVPYPAAADNHQHFNAREVAQSGAALLVPQESLTADVVLPALIDLVRDPVRRAESQKALGLWHRGDSAQLIADRVLQDIPLPKSELNHQPWQKYQTGGELI